MTTSKFEETWSKKEKSLANINSKALNSIFLVDITQFKLISYESVKDVWIILQSAHERTPSVKISKLQMLASKFEDLRKMKSETINDFNLKLCDISKEAFAFGETFRSLPKRFAYKVTAIEVARDLSTMKLDELMGSLMMMKVTLMMMNPFFYE